MHANQDSDDDEDSWFNKDEEELTSNLQSHVQTQKAVAAHAFEEHIECPTSVAVEYLKELNINASAAASAETGTNRAATCRFCATEILKLIKMEPLDAFLYIMTEGNRDIFSEQLTAKDNQQRVTQYTKIIETVCKLELPGFELEVLRSFAAQNSLFEHYKRFIVKLFAIKRSWNETELTFLYSIKFLLFRAYKLKVLTSRGIELIALAKTLSNQCKTNRNSKVIDELKSELENISFENGEEISSIANDDEIYPTLDELFTSSAKTFDNNSNYYKNAGEYVKLQSELLREDFMIPLRMLACKVRNRQELSELKEQRLLFEDTRIKLNPQFIAAKRHGLIFVDLFASERNDDSTKLSKTENSFIQNIKVGALLCFSSSYDFADLVLATTMYTDEKTLKNGYINIDIMRQFNIGNIYEKPLIMFQSPAFFEPYNRVYNYLSKCSTTNFPMDHYIVKGETQTKCPPYCANKTSYTYNGKHFKLGPGAAMPQELPFNEAQKIAYGASLTNDFCLIQGPPGTGKTHLAVELVRTLIDNVKDAATPIVVIAYTNDSLDKFLLKLSAHTQSIMRFGSQSRLPDAFKYNAQHTDFSQATQRLKCLHRFVSREYNQHFTELQTLHNEFDGTDEAYQSILKAQHKLRATTEKLSTIPILTQYYESRNKLIIGMTTTYAAKINFLFHLLKSKIVIFEEAAEILESHILPCLTSHTEHVILIGDHKQLQPYTSSYEHSCMHELNISLFERLIKQNFKFYALNTQYRMRKEIAALICPTIYEKLECSATVEDYAAVRKMSKNLYFLTHETKEIIRSETSFVNEYESLKLYELAQHLLQVANYNPSDLVVLTPYQGQVEKLIQLFSQSEVTASTQIATIDSFQGLEANIILLSLVRSNTENIVGFVRQANRICVALSRAKWGLYIVGNMNLFSRVSKIWRSVGTELKSQDCIGKEFPCLNE